MNRTWIKRDLVILLICLALTFNIPVPSSVSANNFDGLSWEKYSDISGVIPVLDIGALGDLDHPWALSPSVIRDEDVLNDSDPTNDDELYKMWYLGNDIRDNRYSRIFYATSPNGINWCKYVDAFGSAIPVIDYGGAPGGGDEHNAYAQVAKKDNGIYKMWYSGLDASDSHYRTLYATSTDGISWIKHGVVLDIGNPGEKDARYAYAPTIVIDNDAPLSERYNMWYIGHTQTGIHSIFYATSSDGIVWSKYADANGAIPVLETGGAPGNLDDNSVGHPDVVKDEGVYKMWYVGASNYGFKILYATSVDGMNWSKHGESLSPGLPGELDDISVGTPNVLAERNGSYKMWFMGYDGYYLRIFYAYYNPPHNEPPVANAGPDQVINEGEEVHFDGSASSDPDGTIESYEWDFDAGDGLWWDTGAAPDSTGLTPSHTYGDNGEFIATLRVNDDQGATAQDICNITVINVNPSISIQSAFMDVEIGLRVAGRKYNDVGMTLYEDGNPLGFLSIERVPGSPDDQMAWFPVILDMTKMYSANITYIPEDPPDIGSNPVWVYIRFENGSIHKLHHTFNVQQSMKRDSEHWNHVEPWEVDLKGNLTGCAFQITTYVTDPGSDDEILTYTYGTQMVTKIHLNNPPVPDPYPSPEHRPRDIIDITKIIYEGSGSIALSVEDDDAGVSLANLEI